MFVSVAASPFWAAGSRRRREVLWWGGERREAYWTEEGLQRGREEGDDY